MNSTNLILIVDDDVALRRELAEQLTLHEGFEIREAGTGKEALEVAKAHPFAAVLLDVGLPDMDGRDVCRLLRKQGIKAPVIMLTAHSGDADTILGLDSGANDYITKPFRLGVLMARLRAQLRQFELSDDAVFQIGPYSFKPAAKMLVRGDSRKIHLTEKETAILKYLLPDRRPAGLARGAAGRGLGLQCRRDHPHAGNAHLSPAPEDRAQAGRDHAAGDRARRLSTGPLRKSLRRRVRIVP